MQTWKRSLLILCLLALTLVGAAAVYLAVRPAGLHGEVEGGTVITPVDTIPAAGGDGWARAELEQAGIQRGPIEEMVAKIHSGTYQNVDGIVIVRGEKLVFEAYFDGYAWDYLAEDFRGQPVRYQADTRHNLASVTKSFTSALVGIAIDQGLIESVDQPVFEYFSAYAHLNSTKKGRITLEHLLNMSSGLAWNGMEKSLSDPTHDLIQLFRVTDPIAYILGKEAIHEAGTHWYYSGGDTNLLGEVVKKASGERLDQFSTRLFEPLGIVDYEWDFINAEVVHASGNLQLTPRDMAKLGALYLNEGVWAGRQVISAEWVRRSSQPVFEQVDGRAGYGYQWWHQDFAYKGKQVHAQYAAGWGGQYIYMFRELDLVLVFTGGNYTQANPVEIIIREMILPAIKE